MVAVTTVASMAMGVSMGVFTVARAVHSSGIDEVLVMHVIAVDFKAALQIRQDLLSLCHLVDVKLLVELSVKNLKPHLGIVHNDAQVLDVHF